MTFDPTKPVQTRDGRTARIICTDRRMVACPIIALVGNNDQLHSYYADGRYTNNGQSQCDLINVPETKSWWVNVYANGIGFHPTEYAANKCAMVDRITLLEIRMCGGKHVETIQHEVEK